MVFAAGCCFPARIITRPSFHREEVHATTLVMPGSESGAETRSPAPPWPRVLPCAWEMEKRETEQAEELGTGLLKLCLWLGGLPGASGIDGNVALHLTPSVLQLREHMAACSKAN